MRPCYAASGGCKSMWQNASSARHISIALICSRTNINRLYEERWSAVQEFLEQAKPMCLILRSTWDPSCLCANDNPADEESGGLGKFNPHALYKTLQSNLFHAYLNMALRLHEQVPSAFELIIASGGQRYQAKLINRYR